MVFALFSKVFGSSNDRMIKKLSKPVEFINALEERFEKMRDAELKNMTQEFRQRLSKGESLDDILPEAFAVVREAAKRTLGQRHYDVQLIGGIALHKGIISEMRTGEGKTLVATLAAYLNAIEGKGVHVVTVNDYLAKRDSEWMGKVYSFLGLTTGCITADITDEERKVAYAADVTYGTNNEFGFDYLRDNMKFRLDDMVQRDFNFAIVDEVDSILIDEARTPLIISGPSEGDPTLYTEVGSVIPSLIAEEDYELDEQNRTAALTEEGIEKVEEKLREMGILESGSLFDAQNISLVHHANQALKAHTLFTRDTDYIVKDGKVIIIDEFTGRMMEGRRFSDGLHQALEAKEGVTIERENQTMASITFQNYFRLYPKLAGMTGTAMTEATEFGEIYNLDVVSIPTNVPVARIDHEDKIYKTFDDKVAATIAVVQDCQTRQQPVLIGTTSIDKSERISNALKKLKIKHNVLNARQHEQEAFIIAKAGKPSAVTIATNMAGRGTDIQLGGNFEMQVAEEIDDTWDEKRQDKEKERIKAEIKKDRDIVIEAGGLFVIGTERHESRRIDNQLRGRSGRQGDPGTTLFFLSLEDDLMRIFGAEKMEPLLAHRKIGLKDGEALSHPLISKTLEKAQNKVEQQNFEIRKNLLRFDNVMNDQRMVIYEQRREIMDAEQVNELVQEFADDVITNMITRTMPPGSYAEQWDIDTLKSDASRLLNINVPVHDWAKREGVAEQEIKEMIEKAYADHMKAKESTYTSAVWRKVEKSILLQRVDFHWKEHLLAMDHLRQGISLRAIGQRDPLNEYKTEAFGMFQNMLEDLRESVTQTLSLVELDLEMGTLDFSMLDKTESDPSTYTEGRADPAMAGANPAQDMQDQQKQEPFRHSSTQAFDKNNPETWGKVARNALCPCGSGKKYKHCHGEIGQYAKASGE